MKYLIPTMIIMCMLVMPGCGKRGSMKDAKEALAAMMTELDKKAREEVTYDGPIDVDMAARARNETRDPQALAQAETFDYVQFVSERRQYELIEKNFDVEPFEASIRETELYIEYKPVERQKVKDIERRTGEMYDPTRDRIDQRMRLKIVDIKYTYDRKFMEWKEASREVAFDADAEEEDEEEESEE